MNKGWVKIYRELLDKSIWLKTTSDQKAILFTLLLLASHAPRKMMWGNEVIQIKPGQLITSLPSLARESCTSIQAVRTALKKFEKLEFLTDTSTKKGRLITLINWDFYQGQYTAEENDLTDVQQTSNRQSTDEQQTSNRNQELKNEECIIKSSSSSPQAPKIKDDDDDEKIVGQIKKDFPKYLREDIEASVKLAKKYNANDVEKYAIQILRNENNAIKEKEAKKLKKSSLSNFRERENIDFEEIKRLERERIDKELAGIWGGEAAADGLAAAASPRQSND